eukprot:14848010-Alexandrium_andersonii.AAC.1
MAGNYSFEHSDGWDDKARIASRWALRGSKCEKAGRRTAKLAKVIGSWRAAGNQGSPEHMWACKTSA